MRAIRTATTTDTAQMPGDATGEHGLPIRRGPAAGPDGIVAAGDPAYHLPYIATVWEPSHEERAHLALGRNIELVTFGNRTPPLSIGVTDEDPVDVDAAHAQPRLEEPAVWMALPVPVAGALVEVIGLLEARALDVDDVRPEVARTVELLVDLRDGLAAPLAELARLAEDEEREP
jgi:hypothetical protein